MPDETMDFTPERPPAEAPTLPPTAADGAPAAALVLGALAWAGWAVTAVACR
jgi:hypothetical protein